MKQILFLGFLACLASLLYYNEIDAGSSGPDTNTTSGWFVYARN